MVKERPSDEKDPAALRWAPPGKRKRGRPLGSRRRTVEEETREAGNTRNKLSWLAQDRHGEALLAPFAQLGVRGGGGLRLRYTPSIVYKPQNIVAICSMFYQVILTCHPQCRSTCRELACNVGK